MPTSRLSPLIALVTCCVTAAVVSSCSDPVDRAAKQRIFSPEDPPAAVASASEKLPANKLGESHELARRVLRMGAAEATERIGPHVYRATVSFEWSGNGRTNRLSEQRVLRAGRGGVNGDFQGTLETSRNLGLDVLRVRGQVFARALYTKGNAGPYRQRLRDRGMAERERDELYGAVRDVDQLFHGRLKLTSLEEDQVAGRRAWKYTVSLGPASEAASSNEGVPLPKKLEPKGGVDEPTRRRLEFFEHRTPADISGEVWIDAETSVVLRADLDGRLTMKSDAGAASLQLTVNSELAEIGVTPIIEIPESYLPDEDKPQGIAGALARFGLGRAAADAGTTSEASNENDLVDE